MPETAVVEIGGAPEDVRALAGHLDGLARGLGDAGAVLSRVDVNGWSGDAADAFRAAAAGQPPRYSAAAGAFAAAAGACRSYALVLEEGQALARQAAVRAAEADAVTSGWADGLGVGVQPLLVSLDPGLAGRGAASAMVAAARSDTAAAAAAAAGTLRAAAAGAPRAATWLGELLRGAGESSLALADYVGSTSTLRLVTDPVGYVEEIGARREGLVQAAQHPGAAVKALVDWDTWAESPARAVGHLVPDLVIGVATAGGVVAAVRSTRALRQAERLELAFSSGLLRETGQRQGMFGVGTMTRKQADVMGHAWLGPGSRLSSDGTAWISGDGLRQYRPPKYKPKEGVAQANLESRLVPKGPWPNNGHITIGEAP